jgi:hypothetical protein
LLGFKFQFLVRVYKTRLGSFDYKLDPVWNLRHWQAIDLLRWQDKSLLSFHLIQQDMLRAIAHVGPSSRLIPSEELIDLISHVVGDSFSRLVKRYARWRQSIDLDDDMVDFFFEFVHRRPLEADLLRSDLWQTAFDGALAFLNDFNESRFERSLRDTLLTVMRCEISRDMADARVQKAYRILCSNPNLLRYYCEGLS